MIPQVVSSQLYNIPLKDPLAVNTVIVKNSEEAPKDSIQQAVSIQITPPLLSSNLQTPPDDFQELCKAILDKNGKLVSALMKKEELKKYLFEHRGIPFKIDFKDSSKKRIRFEVSSRETQFISLSRFAALTGLDEIIPSILQTMLPKSLPYEYQNGSFLPSQKRFEFFRILAEQMFDPNDFSIFKSFVNQNCLQIKGLEIVGRIYERFSSEFYSAVSSHIYVVDLLKIIQGYYIAEDYRSFVVDIFSYSSEDFVSRITLMKSNRDFYPATYQAVSIKVNDLFLSSLACQDHREVLTSVSTLLTKYIPHFPLPDTVKDFCKENLTKFPEDVQKLLNEHVFKEKPTS